MEEGFISAPFQRFQSIMVRYMTKPGSSYHLRQETERMQHQLAVSPLPALSHLGPSLWNEAAPHDVLPLVFSANAITDANRCTLLMCPLLFNPIPTDRLNPHKRLDICDKRHNSHCSSFEFFGFFLLAFMRESCWVAQAGLRLTAFLLQSCKCQVYRHAPLSYCVSVQDLMVIVYKCRNTKEIQ